MFGLNFTETAMTACGVCYVAAALGWYFEMQKTWMAVTFLLYAMTAVTLYLAGRAS